MTKKYVIGRPYPHSNVLHIDKNEYGFIIAFDSIEDAKNHLYERGYTDEKIETLGIVFEEIEVGNRTPDFLENFIFDIWSCCNEADYSISYDLDDYYRLAVTADRNGWNCELLYNKDIDDVVRNEFIHKTNFREIPEAISRLHDHYEESKENDDGSESEEDEDEEEDPDCQICGCQTDLLLVKDFDGKGFDKRLCPKCLLNEALKKGKLILSNAHFEKDGIMLPVFDYLNTVLDIEPLNKPETVTLENEKVNTYAPWYEYSLSKEECDTFVEKMVSTIRGMGIDEGSGYYGLKSFELGGEKLNLYCEVSKEQEDGNIYYVVYYAVEFDEGDNIWSDSTSTEILDIEELKTLVFEIASRDCSQVEQVREKLGIKREPSTKELKKELAELTTFIDGVEVSLDYSEPVTKQTYEKYENAIARRKEIENLLAERG